MDLNDLAKIIFYQAIVDTYFKHLDLHTSITFDDFADNICDDEIIIKKILHELKGLYKSMQAYVSIYKTKDFTKWHC